MNTVNTYLYHFYIYLLFLFFVVFCYENTSVPSMNRRKIGIGCCSPKNHPFSCSQMMYYPSQWHSGVIQVEHGEFPWFIFYTMKTGEKNMLQCDMWFDFQFQTTRPNPQVWANIDICQGSLCSLASACACPCGAPSFASSGVDAVLG